MSGVSPVETRSGVLRAFRFDRWGGPIVGSGGTNRPGWAELDGEIDIMLSGVPATFMFLEAGTPWLPARIFR